MMNNPTIDDVSVTAYTVPTATEQESDGTLQWDSTTIVIVELSAGGKSGIGYSYTHTAAADLIEKKLAKYVKGCSAFDINGIWLKMVEEIRNLGRPGICSNAISAVDNALWDLKAKLYDTSVLDLIGAVHESVAAYGSGGFCSYTVEQLQEQLGGWAAEGFGQVKMKVGRKPEEDLDRARAAREAIGPAVHLYVDANGAYRRKEALDFARRYRELGVTWFEEPVSSDDLKGLRLIRDQGPPGLDVAAGEYGYDIFYFNEMLDAGAVDVLQADATRCAGITGFLQAATLCEARSMPFSAHTAPTIHAHAMCAIRKAMNVEYFFDHYRIEQMFFDGAIRAEGGRLTPDRSRPGFGIALKRKDAEPYRVA